jgi:hypothetical protein
VGTTEKLYPSMESAAASLKMPLGGTAYGAGEVGQRVRCGLGLGFSVFTIPCLFHTTTESIQSCDIHASAGATSLLQKSDH